VKNSKGFTVIELMVGSIVLLVVILISVSFFRAQTKFGGQLVKDSGTRESVNTALLLIKRDIMAAGRGLASTHQLSFWPSAYSNMAFHEFYVNCSLYMTNNLLDTAHNVFNTDATFTGASPLVLSNVLPQDVYGIMTFNSSNNARQIFQTTATAGSGSTSFAFGGGTGGLPYVPVVLWQLVDPATNNDVPPYSTTQPELRRNGLTVAGGTIDHNLRLQQFGIRCQFVDANGNETWIPSATSGTDFNSQPFDNLKVIEVQLQYQTLKAGEDETKPYSWMQQKTKIMNVTCRNIYLMAITYY
jgi:Tfp pilus assembly protein PilW